MLRPDPNGRGAFRLFRLFGVDVLLHWSWAVVALIEIQWRAQNYHARYWNVIEYLALFGIVLMHEFGHALACRSVGGQAERIVLWPLGGVAYVRPPARPGAVLWSIAAGPLVNLVLVPFTVGAAVLANLGGVGFSGDPGRFFLALALVNAAILVYNMLPVYPLDGGQILQAILWYFVGRARSLMAATVIGLIGAGLLVIGALLIHSPWLIILAVFGGLRAWTGIQQAKILIALERATRHADFACPRCAKSPPAGPFWACPCGARFDTFATDATCPNCRRQFDHTSCTECHQLSPRPGWRPAQESGPPSSAA
jgi:Zn-dependent protease